MAAQSLSVGRACFNLSAHTSLRPGAGPNPIGWVGQNQVAEGQ